MLTGLKVFQNGQTMGSESNAFSVSGFSSFLGMATSYTKLSNHSSEHTKYPFVLCHEGEYVSGPPQLLGFGGGIDQCA